MDEPRAGSGCRRRSRTAIGRRPPFVGALRLTGMTAPMVLDGPMTGEWFLAYTEQVLVPTLRPGDVVILDNLPAHKGTAVREAVEAASATLLFLRHTRPTSIRSRTPSPSSRRCCAKRPPAPSTTSGVSSTNASMRSPQPNAPTTPLPPAMTPTDRKKKALAAY